MKDLRALAEADLGSTLEGEFGTSVTLIAPDGSKQTARGRVLWNQARTNLDTGEVATVPDPVVELRRSSLSRVPETGENWAVVIPEGPRADAASRTCLLDRSRSIEGGKSLGFIKLPLSFAGQKES